MRLFQFLTLAVLVVCLQGAVHAKSWRGIEPLHSTRADVERILGSKTLRCGTSSCIYDLGDQTVFVLYTKDSGCDGDSASDGWRVPAGTVIQIGIHFKQDVPLSSLGFDLSKFEEVFDKELPGWVYYFNLDEGVRVEGSLANASGVTYFQSAKDNKDLSCPSVKKR